jgi:dimethylargininase
VAVRCGDMLPRHAIVRRPSPRLAQGEVTHSQRKPLDLDRAVGQHAAYLTLLQRLGLQLIEAPAADDHPDGVFVEDTLVMIDRGATPLAVLTRPGAASRRSEIDSIEPLLAPLGVTLRRISAPATLDGGDVLVTSRHLLVGRTTRSNQAAVDQLGAIASPRRHALAIEVTGALHLKSAVTALPDGSLIAVPQWVDCEALTALGYRVHRALEPSGGDVMCYGNVVVVPADAPETAVLIEQLGFTVEKIDVSELQKMDAGVTCMSVLV